jgi:hypothetical protein
LFCSKWYDWNLHRLCKIEFIFNLICRTNIAKPKGLSLYIHIKEILFLNINRTWFISITQEVFFTHFDKKGVLYWNAMDNIPIKGNRNNDNLKVYGRLWHCDIVNALYHIKLYFYISNFEMRLYVKYYWINMYTYINSKYFFLFCSIYIILCDISHFCLKWRKNSHLWRQIWYTLRVALSMAKYNLYPGGQAYSGAILL